MPDPDYASLGYAETEYWETLGDATIELIASIWAAGPVWSILEEIAVAVIPDLPSPCLF